MRCVRDGTWNASMTVAKTEPENAIGELYRLERKLMRERSWLRRLASLHDRETAEAARHSARADGLDAALRLLREQRNRLHRAAARHATASVATPR